MRVELALIVGILFFCCWCAYVVVKMNSSVAVGSTTNQQASHPSSSDVIGTPGSSGREANVPQLTLRGQQPISQVQHQATRLPHQASSSSQPQHQDYRQAQPNSPATYFVSPASGSSNFSSDPRLLKPPYSAATTWPAQSSPGWRAPADYYSAQYKWQPPQASINRTYNYPYATNAGNQYYSHRNLYPTASQQPYNQWNPSVTNSPPAMDYANQQNVLPEARLQREPPLTSMNANYEPDQEVDPDSDGRQPEVSESNADVPDRSAADESATAEQPAPVDDGSAGNVEDTAEQNDDDDDNEDPSMPVNKEQEEQIGRRSFSEDQSNASERDRNGNLVVTQRKHLINGRPVVKVTKPAASTRPASGKLRSASNAGNDRDSRSAQASKPQSSSIDFDRIVGEIDGDNSQPTDDYEESPDGKVSQSDQRVSVVPVDQHNQRVATGESRPRGKVVRLLLPAAAAAARGSPTTLPLALPLPLPLPLPSPSPGYRPPGNQVGLNSSLHNSTTSDDSEVASGNDDANDDDKSMSEQVEDTDASDPMPKSKRDSHQHKLHESLSAQRWDDDSSVEPSSNQTTSTRPNSEDSENSENSESQSEQEDDDNENENDREAESTTTEPQDETIEFKDLDSNVGSESFPFMESDRRRRKRRDVGERTPNKFSPSFESPGGSNYLDDDAIKLQTTQIEPIQSELPIVNNMVTSGATATMGHNLMVGQSSSSPSGHHQIPLLPIETTKAIYDESQVNSSKPNSAHNSSIPRFMGSFHSSKPGQLYDTIRIALQPAVLNRNSGGAVVLETNNNSLEVGKNVNITGVEHMKTPLIVRYDDDDDDDNAGAEVNNYKVLSSDLQSDNKDHYRQSLDSHSKDDSANKDVTGQEDISIEVLANPPKGTQVESIPRQQQGDTTNSAQQPLVSAAVEHQYYDHYQQPTPNQDQRPPTIYGGGQQPVNDRQSAGPNMSGDASPSFVYNNGHTGGPPPPPLVIGEPGWLLQPAVPFNNEQQQLYRQPEAGNREHSFQGDGSVSRGPLASGSKSKKKKMKFKKSKLYDSKHKAAKAHSMKKKSKFKKGGMKKKKKKAKKKVTKKVKEFSGSVKGQKAAKGGGQKGAKKGALYYKDKGYKKRGFKKAYQKLETGDHKTYFDEFRDKDHNKKWKNFKDKHQYSQSKKWAGKDKKKYRNFDLNELKGKNSGSAAWKEKSNSKFKKDYKLEASKKSKSSKKKVKRKE